MKKTILCIFCLLLACLNGCQPAPASPPPTPSQAQPAPTQTLPPPTSTQPPPTPTQTQAPPAATAPAPLVSPIPTGAAVAPFDDVRFQDVSWLVPAPDAALIQTLWFNQDTTWPVPSQPVAQSVLEAGKNPGMGIRALHAQGITGTGVNVAIIDQNLLLDHPEFKGKVVSYFDTGTQQPADQGSMHAPAVTSLLVGTTIGTAPGAQVYFAAAPSWTGDAQYYADALNWVVDQNQKLPAAQKIRVVSVSAAPSGPGTPFTKNNSAWDGAYQRATQAGILVLDCTQNHGVTAPCYYDLAAPDNVAGCTPGFPGVSYQAQKDRLYIPTSRRSTAEEYYQGIFRYQYTGQGGLSWSVPYLAGVLALGWQLRPDLSGTQMLDLVFQSAYINSDGLKIIDPPAFINLVNQAAK